MIHIFCFLFVLYSGFAIAQDTYTMDSKASTIRWKGEKFLGQHTGTLQLKGGSFLVRSGQVQQGSFIIDMRSLENEDLEGDRRQELEEWLRSKEMFNTRRYPNVKFKISSVQPLPEKNQYQVEGMLTIKEISHTVTFPASINIEGASARVSAEIVFDRTLWNLNYESGGLVGGLANTAIHDEVTVTVDLEANAEE